MKYIKLILGIVIGLIAITFIAEIIEFFTVKLVSQKSFEELHANQNEYFKIRNRNWILIFKIFYSLLAGITGGYLSAWISSKMAKVAICTLIIIQEISIIWGGFLSDLSSTGPVWMWVYLLIVLPIGIWIGYKWRAKNDIQLVDSNLK